jgi:6-pyruvoyltetrahydropterin/6-carboxytetrahydropterin synthase
MFELRVEHSFPAGHALRNYTGKCANMHGHNYRVQVAVRGPRLNEIGLLMDFSDLRRAIRAAAETLDHQFLNDLPAFADRNPSAENVAVYFYEELSRLLEVPLREADAAIHEIVVQETDTAWAVYRPGLQYSP